MRNLRILLRVVGAIQIVLGLFYLLAPAFFLEAIGHSVPADDIFYPLGMLASRFLVFGVVFIYIFWATYAAARAQDLVPRPPGAAVRN